MSPGTFWKLVAVMVVIELVWAATVVLLPSGAVRGVAVAAGLPAVYYGVLVARRFST